MKRFDYFFGVFFLAFLFFIAPSAKAQGTYTAASCSQSDVNASINGPTHTAVNGDTIQIPAGSCTWTSGIAVRAGIGITIIGNGTPSNDPSVTGASSSCSNTTITWTISGSHMFNSSPTLASSTTRISCMQVNTTGTSGTYPIFVSGTCNSSGCPNFRLDNITIPNGSMCNVSDASFAAVNDVFGVADHNSVGGSGATCNGPVLANVGYGTWKGIGPWGDNSWATPDTFGTNQAFYIENNAFTFHGMGTDMDAFPGNGDFGGGRAVCRFNTFDGISPGGTCVDHGTDTIGRVRGGRQIEFYKNTLNCTGTCSGSVFGERSAVAIVWGNTLTSGNVGSWASINTQRTWRKNAVFGSCDGSAPWDQNDPNIPYYNGGIASLALSGNSYALTASGSPGWSTNQWSSVNGQPFSFHDTTTNFGFQINTNTSNSFTSKVSCAGAGCSDAPATNDSFQILRALVCMDQPGRGQGQLLVGGDCSTFPTGGHLCPVLASTGNPGSVAQALDPIYELNDTGTVNNIQFSSSDSQAVIANRDFYAQNIGQTAQTSSSSPFTGNPSTGPSVGWGLLANMPTTCTPRVGYLATDQGNWNQSSSGGQGELFVCTAPNTWSLSYTPYTYPHPLITGGTTGGTLPNPPTALKATVQ